MPQNTAPVTTGKSSAARGWFRAARELVPGLGVVLVVTIAAMVAAAPFGSLSPLMLAIITGAILTNLVRLPDSLSPGIAFSATKLLRVGIAMLGLQLLLGDILGLGWQILAAVVLIVAGGVAGTMAIGAMLGLGWTQRLLIACGFSICGAAAVAAVDGVTDADEEEVFTAVALVVIFGTLMIPLVPALSAAFGLSEADAGVWAGGAIHEVAQVVAAGGALGETALGIAVMVKLARVLMLAPLIIGIGLYLRRQGGGGRNRSRPPLVPFFVLAFLACVTLRSTGMVPDTAIAVGAQIQVSLLTAAMFALGTGVRVATLQQVGPRPFLLATASTVLVAGLAIVGVLVSDIEIATSPSS
ncbi:YeiH family protein [Dietzia sp. 179-F 9C3 NHS]|uniref:YeiH family protein n=1 Tax=Dietzia sp. 179-F 9C3 NHS TaxID=3374295 RepID=UPI0038793C68